jgi:hypothetical protein
MPVRASKLAASLHFLRFENFSKFHKMFFPWCLLFVLASTISLSTAESPYMLADGVASLYFNNSLESAEAMDFLKGMVWWGEKAKNWNLASLEFASYALPSLWSAWDTANLIEVRCVFCFVL